MNIIFTPDIFWLQSYGGISRYFVRIAEAMSRNGNNVRIPTTYHLNNYLSMSTFGKEKQKVESKNKLSRKFLRLLSSGTLQYEVLKNPNEILHYTFFRRFPPVISRAKKVLTVFDMIDELYQSQTEEVKAITIRKMRAVQEADIILCISEHTRQDLIRLFNVPPAKTIVTYLAADPPPPKSDIDHHPLNGAPYFLYVGLRGGYKNFKAAIKAYARSSFRNQNIKFIAFGSTPFTKEELAFFHSLGLSENDVIHRSGSDAELYNFYRNAIAFIYPSLYEGFGIPPLEAMSVGCPAICSNVSSIPEVVGDAAFLFDPSDHDSIDDALNVAVSDTAARAKKIELGYRQFQKFSWEKCAADTLDAYSYLLGGR